jgi:hypothetical protein
MRALLAICVLGVAAGATQIVDELLPGGPRLSVAVGFTAMAISGVTAIVTGIVVLLKVLRSGLALGGWRALPTWAKITTWIGFAACGIFNLIVSLAGRQSIQLGLGTNFTALDILLLSGVAGRYALELQQEPSPEPPK